MEKIIEEFRLERPSLAQYTIEGLTTFLEDLAAHAAGVTNARHVLKHFEGKPVGDKLVCKSVSAAGKVAFATATGGTSVKSVHKDAAALVKLFQGAATPRRVLGAEKTPLGAGPTATLLRGAAKQPKRECVALIGTGWVHEVLRFKPKHPAVVLDIDDTLVDRQEKLNDGFQFMAEFFKDARMQREHALCLRAPGVDARRGAVPERCAAWTPKPVAHDRLGVRLRRHGQGRLVQGRLVQGHSQGPHGHRALRRSALGHCAAQGRRHEVVRAGRQELLRLRRQHALVPQREAPRVVSRQRGSAASRSFITRSTSQPWRSDAATNSGPRTSSSTGHLRTTRASRGARRAPRAPG